MQSHTFNDSFPSAKYKHTIEGSYMKKFTTSFLMSILAVNAAEKVNSLGEMFSQGELDLKARLSYEHAHFQSSPKDDANALTISNYIGFRTAEFSGISLYAQYHSTQRISSDYDDGRGHNTDEYELVADPDMTRWQQVYADFTLIPDTNVRVGRQEIILDDSRFVGNIGWRQTAQSFDAVSITNNSIEDTKLFFAYSDKVNTIWGNSVDFDSIVLMNAQFTGIQDHTLTGFIYLVDSDESVKDKKGANNKDTATYGFRANGKMNDFKYDATYAYQTDYQDTDDHEAHFGHLHGAYTIGDWTPGAGYMYIDDQSSEGIGFDTLFSTAHKFNGWSDRFLSTNGGTLTDGLQDYYLDVNTKLLGNKIVLAYHYFDDVSGNDDYGMEYNALVARKLSERLTASVKAAYFEGNDDRADAYADDDVNFWVRLDYQFGSSIKDLF